MIQYLEYEWGIHVVHILKQAGKVDGSKTLKDIGSTCLFDQIHFQGHLR